MKRLAGHRDMRPDGMQKILHTAHRGVPRHRSVCPGSRDCYVAASYFEMVGGTTRATCTARNRYTLPDQV